MVTSRTSNRILEILLVLGVILTVFASGEVDIKNPVQSAAKDEVKSLPGLGYTPDFKHYSGYLAADEENNRYWHYWFTESRSEPDKDPLVLWLNGGPGCSSLLGLLTELGPFQISSKGEVVNNPHAWNKNANIIFMESPAGVGFSYAADGDITADDDTTAKQNHQALRSFFKKFPQYKNRPLYLTGESYGGVYLPTLAVLVDEDPEMNLKGVAIGNGYLDANKLGEALVFFSYYHGLIGRSTWKGLSSFCCDNKPPARGLCKFTDASRSDQCSEYVNSATQQILDSGINPYNLYDRCADGSAKKLIGDVAAKKFVGREHFDKSMMLSAFNTTKPVKRDGKLFFKKRASKSVGQEFKLRGVEGDPPCTDDSVVINYLNQKEAREALHIPENLTTPFTTCFDGIKYTMIYPNMEGGLAPQIEKLLNSKRELTLLVYNGDVDLMCNFFGDEWFVDDLNRAVIADYAPWHVNGQVAGFVKHYKGITYMTVKGSGHMVPTDKPVAALEMFQTFLYGHR